MATPKNAPFKQAQANRKRQLNTVRRYLAEPLSALKDSRRTAYVVGKDGALRRMSNKGDGPRVYPKPEVYAPHSLQGAKEMVGRLLESYVGRTRMVVSTA